MITVGETKRYVQVPRTCVYMDEDLAVALLVALFAEVATAGEYGRAPLAIAGSTTTHLLLTVGEYDQGDPR